MCVMTDAPRRLIGGLAQLPRYEDGLELIPAWLGFLKRLQVMKAVNGFAGMAWFYEQLWSLGHEGRTNPGARPFAAFLALDKRNRAILAARSR